MSQLMRSTSIYPAQYMGLLDLPLGHGGSFSFFVAVRGQQTDRLRPWTYKPLLNDPAMHAGLVGMPTEELVHTPKHLLMLQTDAKNRGVQARSRFVHTADD